MDNFELLSDQQKAQKDRLLDRLELSKQKLWSNLESANEALQNVNQAALNVNETIQAINEWIKSVHKEKSQEFSNLPNKLSHTMKTELYCYRQKFEKIKVEIPQAFDYSQVETVNEILVQFDEMP